MLGINAIDSKGGIPILAGNHQVKKAMINAADRVAVLTISEKMNSVMQMKIADLNEVDYLI